MVARKRARTIRVMMLALATLGGTRAETAWAQLLSRQSKATQSKAAPAKDQAPPASFNQQEVAPKLELVKVPVNPSDAIAVVNGEAISRQQLADECVARKGEEILETLVNRKLIEQAMKAKKIEVTAAEIDQEIDNVAARVAHVSREAWLRTLDKEKGISPVQYARDIIYPALALRKLASNRVQVTDKDMNDSFEAMYGDKLRCRLIMVDKQAKAMQIWEELRKNPGGFEKMAQDYSMDTGSRALGGLLAEPITRHAYPQHVSDAAFRQLVDGDPGDKDAAHKPKDGAVSGPIQVAEATWIILKREGIIPAQKVDRTNEMVRKSTYEMIYEVKLKEAMSEYFTGLMDTAAIDNKLTGHVKLANERVMPDPGPDPNVKLMSNPSEAVKTSPPAPAAAGSAATAGVKLPARRRLARRGQAGRGPHGPRQEVRIGDGCRRWPGRDECRARSERVPSAASGVRRGGFAASGGLHGPRRPGSLLALIVLAPVVGCGTVKTTGTARTGTEQLLLTNAWDSALQKVDFRPLTGVPVYLDTTNVSAVDQGWVTSSLRQSMLMQGVLLRAKPEQAQWIVEARVGAYGTDEDNLLIGVPQTTVPMTITGLPAGTIPKIQLAERNKQQGVAKLALFAYDRGSGQLVWNSGTQLATSSSKDVYVLGVGPVHSGSIRSGAEYAGIKLPLSSDSSPADGIPPAASRRTVPFATPAIRQPSTDLDSFAP